jgi:hypothetical protein
MLKFFYEYCQVLYIQLQKKKKEKRKEASPNLENEMDDHQFFSSGLIQPFY